MSKRHHISKQDNFLQNILELKELANKILHEREAMKKDFARLQEIVDSISKELKESQYLQ